MAKNGKLKVADFGIARIEDAGLTQANVMIGTPTYMAPEQFLGTSMDRRVDLYACGVLLYILLTGKPPFTGSQEQLMYKVVHEPPVLPSQVEGANRPHFYDAIVSKALSKNPDHRFASAAAFRDAVQRGVGQPFDTTVWERNPDRRGREGARRNQGTGPRQPGRRHRRHQRQLDPAARPLGQGPAEGSRGLAGQAGGPAGQRAGQARRPRMRRPAQPVRPSWPNRSPTPRPAPPSWSAPLPSPPSRVAPPQAPARPPPRVAPRCLMR